MDIAAKHTDPNAAAREVASIARQRWHVETQGRKAASQAQLVSIGAYD